MIVGIERATLQHLYADCVQVITRDHAVLCVGIAPLRIAGQWTRQRANAPSVVLARGRQTRRRTRRRHTGKHVYTPAQLILKLRAAWSVVADGWQVYFKGERGCRIDPQIHRSQSMKA